MKRKYTQKTIKVLFGLSGNQCAFPKCTNPIIEPATKQSDAVVIAQISHIYAISEDGPRVKSGLTEEELNAPENLVLLCPTHHALVDGQHETYPADMLKEWKKTHESKMGNPLSADLETIQPNVFTQSYFPSEIVDQKIEDEITILRKTRFFMEFDRVRFSLALGRRLVEGNLSGGTDTVRCRALAWCARILSPTEELNTAEEYLKQAKDLGSCPEIDIADAFISSQKGDKSTALNTLKGIDSPISRSAAIMIVEHYEGSEGAVDWLKTTGIDPKELDSDGKYFLLSRQLKLARWESARETLDALNNQDLANAPVLYHMTAITHLLSTVPTEFRTIVLNQLPFETVGFPLASDAAAIDTRRTAHRYFIDAVKVAQQLNCPDMATIDDEYALWLELRNPEDSNKGRLRLEDKLRDPKSALRLVHLGFQFGIKLDLEAVEQEIERQIALHGGITQDAAIARFALAFTQKTPEDIASYISRHYEELSKYLDKKAMQFLQIKMLSQAGQPESANACLEVLLEEGLSEAEESRLRRIIAEAKGSDPIEARKAQFKQTDSLCDLMILVDELESRREWDSLCEYGEILFGRTRSVRDAERLANVLSNTHKDERLIELLRANATLLAQSKILHMHYCWSLYNEGALLEARTELAKLKDDLENPNYRNLQVLLGIALGDWNSLSAYIANECLEKDKRSPHDLISAAQLALHISSPYAKKLIFAAADKGNNDAGILANAYFLASNAGWEGDADSVQWLHKAARLSGDNGPIQKMSLKDVLDRKPDWESRELETWKLLSHGDIPMFIGAQSLNKSLIDLMLFPAFSNLSESDPRRRSAISTYSGKRQPTSFSTNLTVGMEATALLTLSFLNLLDKALDSFNGVYLPHSTLGWLFEEKQKVTFHQPSRIRDAHQVSHLLATDFLEKFIPNTFADSDLSSQVGDELATLISEAEMVSGNDDYQRIVVRSSPVFRLSSLMEEEADLTRHYTVLSGCMPVVDKLRQKGQITAEEEKKARAFLQLHEKPWQNQPEINDRAILYLDDLALTYFLHLGILEKLKEAGFRPIVSPRKVFEANQLISYESISNKIDEAIECIRSAVSSRIESGKIKVGRQRFDEEEGAQSKPEHPTFSVIALAGDCDAIISDDRFLNQHATMDDGCAETPIFSTLDLLDVLTSSNFITPDNQLEYRTLLRRAGYFYVPVSDDELTTHLAASTIKNDKVVETAELKAIRENMLSVRMSNWLQLPKEAPWIDTTLKVFIRVLKSLWKVGADLYDVKIRSNWIVDQVDVRGWAHCFRPEDADNIVKTGQGLHILLLLISPSDAPQEVKDEYWSWLENRILVTIKEQYRELYTWIIEWYKKQVFKSVDLELFQKKIDMSNSLYVRSALAQALLELMPPLIRSSLLEEKEFCEEHGLKTEAILTFGDSGVSFHDSEMFEAIREIFSGALEKKITDTQGKEWKLNRASEEGEIPILTISHDGESLILPDFSVLSLDSSLRLTALNEAAAKVDLPAKSQTAWQTILSEHALKDQEVHEFCSDVRNTPVHIARSIHSKIASGRINVSSLVPSNRSYFERLVGEYDGSSSIREYATSRGRNFFEQLSAIQPYKGFLSSLFLSSHSALTTEIDVKRLKSEDLVRAFDFLEKHGDRISQLGAIEVGLRILPESPEIEPFLIRIVKQIRDDDVDGNASGFKILSSLFLLVDGELSRTRLLSKEPPFYRRLASLSQTALIHRQLMDLGVEIDPFCEWAFKNLGEHFYLQSLTDMRLEPRWNPDLAVAQQFKADFFGRIMNTGKIYEKNIDGSDLFNLVLGAKSESLHSLSEFPYPYLPGPLEGAENSPNILPAELSEVIETQLNADEVGPSSFTALMYFALIVNQRAKMTPI